MTEVIGIDHIYITVSDLQRSESFYDHVLLEALGFRKNKFVLGGDPHVQYFNRHFGYVLRPSRNSNGHDSYAPGVHHFCLRVESVADVEEFKGSALFVFENLGVKLAFPRENTKNTRFHAPFRLKSAG